MLAIALALAGHVAFSLVSQLFVNHAWDQLIILAWQALVDVVLLVFMRIVLHFSLLEEAKQMGQSEKYCSHCHVNVLAEGFCPQCGQALSAVPYHTRTGSGAVAPAPAGGAA
jgi:hypothetical protein